MKTKDDVRKFELVTWERDKHGNPIKRIECTSDDAATIGDLLENVEQVNEARKPKKKGQNAK